MNYFSQFVIKGLQIFKIPFKTNCSTQTDTSKLIKTSLIYQSNCQSLLILTDKSQICFGRMFYIFLPSLGERGRLDTDNVSPEIENLIILSTSLHSTLVGALLSSPLIRFIINQIPSVPPRAALTSDKAGGRLLWLELRPELPGELGGPACRKVLTRTSILGTWTCHYTF